YAWTRVSALVGPDTRAQLKNIPRHLISAGTSVDLPWRISAVARYSRTLGAFLNDENTLPLDGASTLAFRIRRPLKRQTLFVDVLNATNNTYEEYGYTLTDFRGGIVPYAFAGAPRAVRGGAMLSF